MLNEDKMLRIIDSLKWIIEFVFRKAQKKSRIIV